METARFESPVINNLRVVGSLDYNGKVTRQYRCWATFRRDDNPTLVVNGGTNSRMMLAPARLFDYATSESSTNRPFAPPTNARIVSFTVAGKTAVDQDILANMNSTKFATIGTAASYSLGIQRCPLPTSIGVDDKASRDTTSAWSVRIHSPAAALLTPQPLVDTAGRISARTNELSAGNDNPYAYYYQYLSPLVQPSISPLNRHIGVLYEGADATFKASGGSAVRFEWGAPPAVSTPTVTTITTANPGLSLVLVLSTNRATPNPVAAGTNDYFQSTLAADLTVDVTIVVEIDKNNDSQNPQQFASGAWSAVDLQSVVE